MNGSSSTHTSSGSDGIINGTFGAVEYAEYLLNTYKDAVVEAIDEFSQSEKQRIKRLASSPDSSWNKLKDSLNVQYDYDSGEFVYKVDGNSEEQRLSVELEYGTPDTPPNSLLRSAALTGAQTVESEVANGVRRRLHRGR